MNKNKFLLILLYVLFFLTLIIFLSTIWAVKTFGDIQINQVIFTLFSSLSGTDTSIVISYILICVVIPLCLLGIIGLIYYKFNHKLTFKVKILANIFACLTLITSIIYANNQFLLIDYVVNAKQTTDIYEQKEEPDKIEEEEYYGDENLIYQDVGDAVITGEDTNNLIYIYLESYENSFMDHENGGLKDINCLSELTQLAKDNISFSNTDKMGGPIPFSGTTWTIASMTAQSTGLPLKNEVLNNMDQYDSYMPGAITINDVLHKRGYQQVLLIGSKKEFAGTDKLFEQHGAVEIVDYQALKNQGRIEKGESNKWGVSDQCLFRNAKLELERLAATGDKFNFTMATMDTHTPDGYRCSLCPTTYNDRYENIYACQSKQVSEFITWCKQQSWYANTTIVIIGDHKTMAENYTSFIDSSYTRTNYNCIINSRVTTDNIKNRTFTLMDMYPTTLAAMGFEIKGNKLALGTNLFSPLPTVIEKYGVSYIEQEIQKSSEYLDQNIYQFY